MDTLHSASDTVVGSVTSAFFLALLFVLSHLCHHAIQPRVAGTGHNPEQINPVIVLPYSFLSSCKLAAYAGGDFLSTSCIKECVNDVIIQCNSVLNVCFTRPVCLSCQLSLFKICVTALNMWFLSALQHMSRCHLG